MEEKEVIELTEKISFHDKDNNLFTIEIEIKNGKLSMTGEHGGSCGQCQDSINPLNKEQTRLKEIWNEWHLNDMNAGTPKQEEAIKKWRTKRKKENYDYKDTVKYLKKIKLYSDKGYKYGSKWLKRELPKDLNEEIRTICQLIRQQENTRKEELKKKSFNNTELEDKAIALALSLELDPAEAEKDINEIDNETYDYCGITYFVGTEEETRERARDYLDDELWKMAVAGDRTTSSLEEWQEEVLNSDGYGSVLNSWNGSEDTQTVNGTEYYIIRM